MTKAANAPKEFFTATCTARTETLNGAYYELQSEGETFLTYLTERSAAPLTIGEKYNIGLTKGKVLFQNIKIN